MTAVIERADLTALTDDQLAAAYFDEGADLDAIDAEHKRREHARQQRRQARRQRQGGWYEAAYQQFLNAEAATAGVLLNAKGISRQIEPFSLWSGSQWCVDAYASWELLRFWETHPRLTVTEYERQQRRERREERDYAMDRDDRSAVRQEQGEGPEGTGVHQERAGHDVSGVAARRAEAAGTGCASADAGRSAPVRPGVTVTAPPRTADEIRASVAARQAQAGMVRTVADDSDPAPVPRAYVPLRAPAEVAVRERPAAARYQADDGRGALLLDLIARYIGHYAATSARNLDTITLWNGHAAARARDDTGLGRLIWRASPRLMLTSSDRGSGKSTVLDLSRILQGNPPRLPKVTGRSLASRLGRKHEAVMLDEVKLLFGAGQASKDVQSILLDGYTPGGVWGYTSGQKDVDIPCFGPVAYAAKDELVTATADQLGDLFDRSIKVRMLPASRIMPEVDEIAEDDGAQLAKALVMWTDMMRPELKAAAKSLAESDREREHVRHGDARLLQIWRPLRAVAMVAGSDWPERAQDAMSAMKAGGQSGALDDALGDLEARFATLPAAPQAEDEDDWEDE